MPIHAPSSVTSHHTPESIEQPLSERPKAAASTSTSGHPPAADYDRAENVINAFTSGLGGLHLADSQEKQTDKDLPDKPASGSSNTNLRQTHLGFRPGSEVHKASNGAVDSSGNKATLGVTEIVDKKFGERMSGKAGGAGDFKKKYRMDQSNFFNRRTGKLGEAGSGLDEQISTASTAKIRDEFKKEGFSDNEVNQLIGRMSMGRTGTEQLGWSTTKTRPGIGSHPGGLSKSETDMRQGITDEHNTKDKERAKAVMHQFEADKSKWTGASSQEEKLKGAKQSIDNMATLGKAYSTQHFMQPAPQLETTDLSKMPNGYHSRFGQIIGNDKTGQKGVKGPGFNQWTKELHNTREREKASAASSLIKNGYGSLVHPDMVNHLNKYNSDPDQALNHQTDLPLGPQKSQANFPSEAMTLEEMKAHNAQNPQQPYYLIGPPRGMVRQPENEITEVRSKRPRSDDNVDEAGPSKRPKMDESMRMDEE
jgi:hypothetical protein